MRFALSRFLQPYQHKTSRPGQYLQLSTDHSLVTVMLAWSGCFQKADQVTRAVLHLTDLLYSLLPHPTPLLFPSPSFQLSSYDLTPVCPPLSLCPRTRSRPTLTSLKASPPSTLPPSRPTPASFLTSSSRMENTRPKSLWVCATASRDKR